MNLEILDKCTKIITHAQLSQIENPSSENRKIDEAREISNAPAAD